MQLTEILGVKPLPVGMVEVRFLKLAPYRLSTPPTNGSAISRNPLKTPPAGGKKGSSLKKGAGFTCSQLWARQLTLARSLTSASNRNGLRLRDSETSDRLGRRLLLPLGWGRRLWFFCSWGRGLAWMSYVTHFKRLAARFQWGESRLVTDLSRTGKSAVFADLFFEIA